MMPYFHWSKEVRNVPCLYCHFQFFHPVSPLFFDLVQLYCIRTKRFTNMQNKSQVRKRRSYITLPIVALLFIGISFVFPYFFLAVALRLISLCDTVFGTFGCYFAQVRYLLLFSLNMLWIDTHLVFPFIFHSSLMKEELRNDFSVRFTNFSILCESVLITTTRGNLLTFLSEIWIELDC